MKFINKSFLTNLTCLLFIAVGFVFKPGLYREIILSAGLFGFSGALTNWLAVKMIFEKIPFFYGSGVVVIQFESIKCGIRRILLENFFSEENFKKFKEQSLNIGSVDLSPIFKKLNFDLIFDEIKKLVIDSSMGKMLEMFGGESAIEQFRPEFKAKLPQILNDANLAQFFSETFSDENLKEKVKTMIDQRLGELTPENIKEIVEKMIREHLGWLIVWGGIFGGIIGIVSSLILQAKID